MVSGLVINAMITVSFKESDRFLYAEGDTVGLQRENQVLSSMHTYTTFHFLFISSGQRRVQFQLSNLDSNGDTFVSVCFDLC